MTKKLITLLISASLLILPVAALAINPGGVPGIFNGSVVDIINAMLNFVWPIFIGFAVLMFLVAGFMFLSSRGDPSKAGIASRAVLWGAVGVVAGILAFSIPFVIRNTLGL